MSDAGPQLPPAAFEITESRRAVEHAAGPLRTVPLWVAIGAVLALVAILVLTNRGPGDRLGAVIAAGIVGTAVIVALLVVLPLQLAVAARRRRASEAGLLVESAADRLRAHLAEIGYAVPAEVAVSWVSAPDSPETVALVHDSVIAARWWQPAPGDNRVFVEPFLRQESGDSALPVLPPVG